MSKTRKLRLFLLGAILGIAVFVFGEQSGPISVLDLMFSPNFQTEVPLVFAGILSVAFYWLWSKASPTFLFGNVEGKKWSYWRTRDIVGVSVLLIVFATIQYQLITEGFGFLPGDLRKELIVGAMFFVAIMTLVRFPYGNWRLDMARVTFLVWIILFLPPTD